MSETLMRILTMRNLEDSGGLCPSLALLACVFAALLGQACAAEPSAIDSPVSPEESLKHFELSPGLDLRIDLVAAEPQVVDPIAIAFDEQGLMYVVEMRDYPHGPAEGEKPLSQIRLLEDRDGDGRYETSHLFADGLLFPTGVLPWDGGVIVTLAGEVRFLKDTDGDHKADVNEVWFTGFSQDNSQLRANHPTFGPDGKIYIANGLRGGKVKAVKEGWPQQEIDIRDHDFRFDPRTGVAEAVTGGSQFGLTFDAFGNRFICSNRNPGDHVVLELRDLERNPHLAIGKPTQVVAAAGDDSRVYPLVEAWTTSTLHAGQFTAACAVKIFDGDALPAECIGDMYTCEPTGSLVHREVLEPVGGTFRATPAEQQAEFLASHDPWFRPVNLTVGPDGALYVVDMYRAVIEHPQWMPTELRTRRDLRWGDDRGRIYRVAAKNKPPGKMPTLDANDTGALAAAMDDSNVWMRETAARLLADSDLSVLERVAKEGQTAEGRVLAMQIVNERHPTKVILLDVEDPRAVATWVRSVAPYAEIASTILQKLAESENARVRFEVARAVSGPWTTTDLEQTPESVEILATVAARDAADRWTRAAILTSTADPLALYDAVVERNADGAVPFLVDLAELIGRRDNEEELGQFLSRLASTGPEAGWALPILTGLGRGLGGTLEPALAAAPDRDRQRLAAVFAAQAAIANDDTASVDKRIEAVRVLALAERSFALPSLLELASVDQQSVRIAVVGALGRFRNDDRIAPALLEEFGTQTPAVRNAILTALLADPGRATAVIDAVEAGEVSAAELGATRISALRKHRDTAVRERVNAVFVPPADRQQVLDDYADVVHTNGDPERGQAVFKQHCATCHRIAGFGTQVGPDIADSRTRTPEALLTDILDPNRAIDGRYVAFSVVLTDGTTQTGLIESETSSAVTLAQPDGKTITLLRDEIEVMHSDGMSLMPVGLEKSIPKQEMADLITFIKNWRYLDGTVPLGEK